MKAIIFFVSLAIMWGGGQGVYTWFANMEQTEIACEEFLANGSEKDWLKVTDCFIDNSAVVVTFDQKTGKIDETNAYYLPIKASESSQEVRAFLKINSKDQRIIYSNIFRLQDNEEEFEAFFEEHPEQLEFAYKAEIRDLNGLRLFGIDSDDEDRKVLSQTAGGGDFTILDENEKPDAMRSFVMLCAGLLILVLLVVFSGKSDKEA